MNLFNEEVIGRRLRRRWIKQCIILASRRIVSFFNGFHETLIRAFHCCSWCIHMIVILS